MAVLSKHIIAIAVSAVLLVLGALRFSALDVGSSSGDSSDSRKKEDSSQGETLVPIPHGVNGEEGRTKRVVELPSQPTRRGSSIKPSARADLPLTMAPFPHLRGGQNLVQKMSQNRSSNDRNLLGWVSRMRRNSMDPLSRIEGVDQACVAAGGTKERPFGSNPVYSRRYFDPSSSTGEERDISEAQLQRRSELEPQAMCRLTETIDNPDLFQTFEEANEPQEWEYYVRQAGQCSVRRTVQCDKRNSDQKNESEDGGGDKTPIKDPIYGAPFTAEERLVKGRALVLIMISSFDPLIRTPEWENMDYFLRMATLHSKSTTELYDGVDFVFYRIHGSAEVVTLCKERQNVRTLWVPPGPCDLCAHGRVLKYLGFRPEYSTRLPHFSLWPYKTVVVANTGVRGPFLSSESSNWIDVVSMAGQPSRPKYFFDDLAFTTVAGVHVDPRDGPGADRLAWKGNVWPMPWHLQSYFLMIPLSSLAYYFRLFDEDTACVSDSKLGCILISELRTVFPFVEVCANKLWLGPVDERRFQIHSLAWGFTFDSRNQTTAVTKKFNLTELQTPGYMVDPCKGIFVKFGGEVFRLLNNEFRLAVSVLSRHSTLTLPAEKQRALDPGFVSSLFGRQGHVNKTTSSLNKKNIGGGGEAEKKMPWSKRVRTQCNILY